MDSMNLTFFGGINEIGGNKVLLEDKSTRVFLDFGTSFSMIYSRLISFLSSITFSDSQRVNHSLTLS